MGRDVKWMKLIFNILITYKTCNFRMSKKHVNHNHAIKTYNLHAKEREHKIRFLVSNIQVLPHD